MTPRLGTGSTTLLLGAVAPGVFARQALGLTGYGALLALVLLAAWILVVALAFAAHPDEGHEHGDLGRGIALLIWASLIAWFLCGARTVEVLALETLAVCGIVYAVTSVLAELKQIRMARKEKR